MGVLSDLLTNGYRVSADALNVLSLKTGELMESTGAKKILDDSVRPGLASMTEQISAKTTDLYNNGVPVVKESASQIATLTVAASQSAYKNVDEMTGGQVSATVSKASEIMSKGVNSVWSYGSSWLGWGAQPHPEP